METVALVAMESVPMVARMVRVWGVRRWCAYAKVKMGKASQVPQEPQESAPLPRCGFFYPMEKQLPIWAIPATGKNIDMPLPPCERMGGCEPQWNTMREGAAWRKPF